MDPIRDAFQRIKQEISELQNQIIELKNTISLLNNKVINTQNQPNNQVLTPNYPSFSNNPTHFPTQDPQNYTQNNQFSSGNRGVPTDRQTNRQTDRHMFESSHNQIKTTSIDDFEQASKILETLDNIKKEIRKKFKKLTPQEMTIFSNLYILDDKNPQKTTYKILANTLKLSESSIRDYINKLIQKGIPIQKTKNNNKIITLSISNDLKNITNLKTIQQLREL